ncbi:MAG: hypothetical protein HKL95_11685 [Phycisphaerae bacterium]|nr:hypothetical protein [Phycisphaerae bacterium]
MNLLEATDAPVVWLWGDAAVAMPVWTIADLKTVLARLQAEKIAQLQRACAEAKVSAVQRVYVLARARWQPLGPGDAVAYFRTVEGVEEALRHALTRAGIDARQIQAMLAATPFAQLANLAQDVLRLESPEGPPASPGAAGSAEPERDTTHPFVFPPEAP